MSLYWNLSQGPSGPVVRVARETDQPDMLADGLKCEPGGSVHRMAEGDIPKTNQWHPCTPEMEGVIAEFLQRKKELEKESIQNQMRMTFRLRAKIKEQQ